MKPLLLLILLTGCSTLDVETINKSLLTSPAYTFEHRTLFSKTRITVVKPQIGVSAAIDSAGGIAVLVPTNVTMNIQYQVPTPVKP